MNRILSPNQLVFCLAFGVALWIGAIGLIRFLAPMGGLTGWGLVISYLVLIPGTVPAVMLTRSRISPFRDDLVLAVAIITAVALLLDGLTMAIYPAAYGASTAHQLAAAGFIMWGGGVGLVLAIVLGESR